MKWSGLFLQPCSLPNSMRVTVIYFSYCPEPACSEADPERGLECFNASELGKKFFDMFWSTCIYDDYKIARDILCKLMV